MKNQILVLVILLCLSVEGLAQTDSVKSTFRNPVPPNYEVKKAVEIESLVPMFFTGGYHFGLCYRFEKFRVRVSVINGGTYDAEPVGLKNSSSDFKRYYKTSPGLFFGYNVWKNLELYSYIELHTFEIEQKSTGLKKDIHSADFGGGVSYQFFLGRHFYVQPGLHFYFRNNKSVDFNGTVYNIPNVDVSPVIRLGYRLWGKF